MQIVPVALYLYKYMPGLKVSIIPQIIACNSMLQRRGAWPVWLYTTFAIAFLRVSSSSIKSHW